MMIINLRGMINYRHFRAFSCLTLVRTNITSDDGEEGVASLDMVITRSRYIVTHICTNQY